MSNIAIFIDYDNVYISLQRYYEDLSNKDIDIKTKIVELIKNRYSNDNILIFNAYLDFNTIKLSEDEFDKLKSLQVKLNHVFSGDNASDIVLIIEIIKTIFINRDLIDKFLIVSSDSDMIPLIKEVKNQGKELAIGYFECNTNSNYVQYLNSYSKDVFSLEQLLGLKPYSKDDNNRFIYNQSAFINKLQIINDYIKSKYDTYLKLKNGIPTVYGTCNKFNLRDCLYDNYLFVKEDILNGLAVEHLLTNKIVYEYTYNMDKNKYTTCLLNQDYLNANNISINNLITEQYYQKHIDNASNV